MMGGSWPLPVGPGATSCSVGSVKQKVHRAYRKLRDRMGAMDSRKGSSGRLP